MTTLTKQSANEKSTSTEQGKRKQKTSEKLTRMEQQPTPSQATRRRSCSNWVQNMESRPKGRGWGAAGWEGWVLSSMSCILESMLVGTSCSQLKAKYDKRKFCAEPRVEIRQAQRHPNRKEAALRCATVRGQSPSSRVTFATAQTHKSKTRNQIRQAPKHCAPTATCDPQRNAWQIREIFQRGLLQNSYDIILILNECLKN